MRRLYHSFMLFGGCSCSRCIAYRRSHCCVEQSETVFEVVFRCQFLPVCVKRRPSFPDTILDFGRFLLMECNQLSQFFSRFHFLSRFQFKYRRFAFLFSFPKKRMLWLLKTFVFPWWILRPTFSVLSLNSYIFEADPWRLRTKARRRRTSKL